MGWLVQCGCGQVYVADDPYVLLCPNPECTMDFGPNGPSFANVNDALDLLSDSLQE